MTVCSSARSERSCRADGSRGSSASGMRKTLKWTNDQELSRDSRRREHCGGQPWFPQVRRATRHPSRPRGTPSTVRPLRKSRLRWWLCETSARSRRRTTDETGRRAQARTDLCSLATRRVTALRHEHRIRQQSEPAPKSHSGHFRKVSRQCGAGGIAGLQRMRNASTQACAPTCCASGVARERASLELCMGSCA